MKTNGKVEEDTRTPEEILDLIEAKQKEMAEAIAKLRAIRQDKIRVRLRGDDNL